MYFQLNFYSIEYVSHKFKCMCYSNERYTYSMVNHGGDIFVVWCLYLSWMLHVSFKFHTIQKRKLQRPTIDKLAHPSHIIMRSTLACYHSDPTLIINIIFTSVDMYSSFILVGVIDDRVNSRI